MLFFRISDIIIRFKINFAMKGIAVLSIIKRKILQELIIFAVSS